MKEKDIKKIIIDCPETWVKVTQSKSDSFLSDWWKVKRGIEFKEKSYD